MNTFGFAAIWSNGLYRNYPTLPLQRESSHGQYTYKWVPLCSNKTLFTKTDGRPALAWWQSFAGPWANASCVFFKHHVHHFPPGSKYTLPASHFLQVKPRLLVGNLKPSGQCFSFPFNPLCLSHQACSPTIPTISWTSHKLSLLLPLSLLIVTSPSCTSSNSLGLSYLSLSLSIGEPNGTESNEQDVSKVEGNGLS